MKTLIGLEMSARRASLAGFIEKGVTEEMQVTASIVGPLLNSVALIVAALWVYSRFRRQREREPGADVDIEVEFVGLQKNFWLIEVTALLENKSLVQHKYKDFEVVVRYLLPEDEVSDEVDKKNVNYQLRFPRTINERIGGKKRYFENAAYINPRLKFKHRYITAVPMDATFVWVQCKFFFEVSPTLWLRLVSFVKGDARRATRLGEKTQQSEEANEEKTQQSEKTNEEKTQQSEKTNVQRLEKCNAQRLFKVPEAEPERQSVT